MKVVCINNKSTIKQGEIPLTIGEVYEIVERSEDEDIKNSYKIISDDNEIGFYHEKRFITQQEYREIQLNEILNENIRN